MDVLDKIGMVVKQDDQARSGADKLESWLNSEGMEVVRMEFNMPLPGQSKDVIPEIPADLFCVFALGGDGTFLSAVRWIGDRKIPILGIKFGEVGFLADSTEGELIHVAETVLKRKYTINPRMRLSVRVTRERDEVARETVLNDVVINRPALARLAYLQTYIDNQYITEYRADGLIVSTPTGSTAYALAAGGPIVHPEVNSILLAPICPFTLTNRPLILPDSVSIKIRLIKESADMVLTFDGQAAVEVGEKDTITISKSQNPIHIMMIPGYNYFDVLKTKLRWSGGRV